MRVGAMTDSYVGSGRQNGRGRLLLLDGALAASLVAILVFVFAVFSHLGADSPKSAEEVASELTAADLPEKVAFAFLDGDFYESTRDSLLLVGDKMAQNGVMVVHDYRNLALPGVARAVDEWTQGQNVKLCEFERMVVIYF